MVTKIYECPVHGEFEIELGMNESLEECPECKSPVTRVFQPTTSIWKCNGAVGKIYGCP